MGVTYHPPQGCIVRVDFDSAFRLPEMQKPRLCVVLSKPMKARGGLCTVVPLSRTVPEPRMPYHLPVKIPFPIPAPWGNIPRWLKGDMVYAASFARVDLLRAGKDGQGRRIYVTDALPPELFCAVQDAVLHGLSLGELTKCRPVPK